MSWSQKNAAGKVYQWHCDVRLDCNITTPIFPLAITPLFLFFFTYSAHITTDPFLLFSKALLLYQRLLYVDLLRKIIIILNEQGSFVTGALSTALAAHCGALLLYLHALYVLSTESMGIGLPPSLLVASRGISVPPYSTYMQSFNFRSTVVPGDIAWRKKRVIYNHPASQSATHPDPVSSIWQHSPSAALRN